jgi:transposase
MRKIHDVLRLHAGGLSKRRIAVSLNIGRTAVGDYINRATHAGVSWPLPEDQTEADLEQLLFPPAVAVSADCRPPPDWPMLHRDLKRPGVTLSLLWEEYRAVHRDGYGYSLFCELYRAWKGGLAPTMRQTHVAGEKIFVDYAGATLEVIDGLTGEVRAAQIFVATLGASSYTYAKATWTQALPNWIGSHCRAFAYFGGVPAQVVPDNLKSHDLVRSDAVRAQKNDGRPPYMFLGGAAVTYHSFKTKAIAGADCEGDSGAHAPDS